MLHTNRTQKEQVEYTDWAWMLEAGGMNYWDEAAAYCADTDTMPLRCDHLVANRCTLSGGGGTLVLVFAAMLALIPTVQDLDQTADEEAVMMWLTC